MEYPSKRQRLTSPPATFNDNVGDGFFIERPMSETGQATSGAGRPHEHTKTQGATLLDLRYLHNSHLHRHITRHAIHGHQRREPLPLFGDQKTEGNSVSEHPQKDVSTPRNEIRGASLTSRLPAAQQRPASSHSTDMDSDRKGHHLKHHRHHRMRHGTSRNHHQTRPSENDHPAAGVHAALKTGSRRPQPHPSITQAGVESPQQTGNHLRPKPQPLVAPHSSPSSNRPNRPRPQPVLVTRPLPRPSSTRVPLIPLIISAAGVEVTALPQYEPSLVTELGPPTTVPPLPPPITVLPPLPTAIQPTFNPTLPSTLLSSTTTTTETSLTSTTSTVSTTTITSLTSTTTDAVASVQSVTSTTVIPAVVPTVTSTPTTLITSTSSVSASFTSSSRTQISTSTSSSTNTFSGFGASPSNEPTESPSASSGTGSGTNVPTPTLVGSVVGGVAGLTVLLLLLLLLLRWYKRRKFGPARGIPSGEPSAPSTSAGETTEIAGAAGGAAVSAGLLKRMSRPRSTPPPVAAERSFERISGRKLPSQFSPGMEGPSKEIGAAGLAYSSGTPTYPSGGTFDSAEIEKPEPVSPASPLESGGDSLSTPPAAEETSGPLEKETMMPGPARTPVLHQGEGQTRSSYLASASRSTPSPVQALQRASLGRSQPSFDGSRGSKFTEDVV